MTKDESYRDFVNAEVFSIHDDNTADWAIRCIRDDLDERDRLIEIAKAQIEDLKNEIDDLTEEYDRKISFLKSCLFKYFTTVKHKETKTQESYKLLNGSLVLKKASDKIVKDDDDALLKYFDDNNMTDFIKTVRSPKWAEFKKRLEIDGDQIIDTETGEIVEAVLIEQSEPKFEIKF